MMCFSNYDDYYAVNFLTKPGFERKKKEAEKYFKKVLNMEMQIQSNNSWNDVIQRRWLNK